MVSPEYLKGFFIAEAIGFLGVAFGIAFYAGTDSSRRWYRNPANIWRSFAFVLMPAGLSFIIAGVSLLLAKTVFGVPIFVVAFGLGQIVVFLAIFTMFKVPEWLKPKWVREEEAAAAAAAQRERNSDSTT